MGSNNIYSRKISSKEAEDGFIFVLKNSLSFFPPLEEDFILKEDDTSSIVRVDSYPCTCRGPDLPHKHYFINWEGLMAGNKIEIKKDPLKSKEYNLKIFF